MRLRLVVCLANNFGYELPYYQLQKNPPSGSTRKTLNMEQIGADPIS